MKPHGLVLAVAVLLLALAAGVVSLRATRDQLAVLEACEALDRGDYDVTLRTTEGRVAATDTGQAAAECRCRAQLATGADDACSAMLEALWQEAPAWVPSPDLAAFAIAERRSRGETRAAATLARRAGAAYPERPDLFQLELELRASVEDEVSVLRDLAARLPVAGPRAAQLRAVLAQRYLRRGDAIAALEALGAELPRDAGAATSLWFDTRATAHAMNDDLVRVKNTHTAWRDAGGDPRELKGRYALTLSVAGLADPEQEPIALLEQALEALGADPAQGVPEYPDRALREGLAIRLVLTLASAERLEEALATYDRYQKSLGLDGLTRDELVRAARQRTLAGASPSARRGTLAFQVANPDPDARLLVSPDLDAPLDADFESIRVPRSGRLELSRTEGDAPTRWALHTRQGLVASGTITPRAGAHRGVSIVPNEPVATAVPASRTRRAGDGRTRVVQLLLDCGDWRLIQYLRARGELPVLSSLLADGSRAVLESDPPLTAAALEALVWPERRGDASLLGIVHRMGVELAGLSAVGDNPFEALRWALPESADLFSTIGAGERRAANLLLAHGGIRAGRHGEVSGPDGARSRVAIGNAARDLTREERRRFPALADIENERDRLYARTIAAELDVAAELAADPSLDLVSLRVEPLDILTHAHFSRVVADGQDDGRRLLFEVYRYIDARLAAVDAALDADDVLLVMSDHGIRTAMAHSRDAFFVAVGAAVPHGRTPGRPALRGVSRVVADLLSVETGWPDTGIAPWARPVPAQLAAD
jgi:tetratricopeptide (TPR) repeat protein